MPLLGVLAGCKKEADTLPPAVSTDSMPPASPRGLARTAEDSTNAVVIPDTGDVNATLQRLTQELRNYVVRTRNVPKDFEEFAAKGQLTFPPAPAGQKYIIKGQAVSLAKR